MTAPLADVMPGVASTRPASRDGGGGRRRHASRRHRAGRAAAARAAVHRHPGRAGLAGHRRHLAALDRAISPSCMLSVGDRKVMLELMGIAGPRGPRGRARHRPVGHPGEQEAARRGAGGRRQRHLHAAARPAARRTGRAVQRTGRGPRPARPGTGARAGPRGQPSRARRLGQPRPAHARSPGCGRWPRRSRTRWSPTRGRSATTTPRSAVETDRLAAMIDDLFELSKIHAGTLRLSPRLVGLEDLIAEVVASAEPVARAKGVRLTGSAVRACLCSSTPAEFGRAVRNLVTNAIRHTPPRRDDRGARRDPGRDGVRERRRRMRRHSA